MEAHQREELKRLPGVKLFFDHPLKERTTLRIGGPAEVLAIPDGPAALAGLLRFAKGEGIPYFILGRGSNLLIRDGGIRGIVIDLASAFDYISMPSSELIEAGAAVTVPQLLKFCLERELTGLEFLAGIPGSVGGVLIMNAGTKAGEVKGAVTSLKVMDPAGEVLKLPTHRLKFHYRGLELPPGLVILSGQFRVKRGRREEIQARMGEALDYRRRTQPVHLPNAGSIFKNPPGDFAGRIIEELGLKGLRVGGAEVSTLHANFIVNTGYATAKDVITLIELIRDRVYKERGIRLELELIVVGAGRPG